MDELVTWLRAQVDDDERVAREADPEPEHWEQELGDHRSVWDDPNGEFHARGGPVFDHVLRNRPKRVLAEVEAKRWILAHIGMVVISPGREALAPEYVEQMELFARLLALPYADRAGYLEEWRPA